MAPGLIINMSQKLNKIPDFPGYDNSKSLTRANSSAASQFKSSLQLKEETNAAIRAEVKQTKLRIISDSVAQPTPTRMSQNLPVKQFDQAPHKFALTGGRVDSKSEFKSQYSPSGGNGYKNGPTSPNVPKYVGSTFFHIANAPTRPVYPPPLNPTIPQPYAPIIHPPSPHSGIITAAAANSMLNNRTPSGQIIGNQPRRFIESTHVPYLPPDVPVGPNNPTKELSDTWTACWDNEVGGIYYYNKITGEATWVPPNNV